MPSEFIRPVGLAISPAYSHAVIREGTPVFIAGQVAQDAAGNVVGEGDARMQAMKALQNLRAVVSACGGSMEDIVKLTVYTTSLSHRPAIGEARKAFFAAGKAPASTFLVVSGLADPRYLVEIEAVAMIAR